MTIKAILGYEVADGLTPERGPAGRTDFAFYVIAESTEVTRESLAAGSDVR